FSALGRVLRQNSAWSQACRHSGRAADQVRLGHQPQDREGARPRSPTNAARARRRGDRMIARRKFVTLLGGAGLIVPTGGEPAAIAAKSATSSIPIVFATGSDPIKAGLVASYNRPGGNATGINFLTADMEAKRLGLLHEMLPQAQAIAFLYNPKFVVAEDQLRDAQEAARTLGLQIAVFHASTESEINAAFRTMAEQRIAALTIAGDPFFDTRRGQLFALAAYNGLPAMYQFREYAVAGGLISYGIDAVDAYHQVGIYAARILKGAKTVDLPVLQPTKFELVINLNTAKALGLEVPPTLLA